MKLSSYSNDAQPNKYNHMGIHFLLCYIRLIIATNLKNNIHAKRALILISDKFHSSAKSPQPPRLRFCGERPPRRGLSIFVLALPLLPLISAAFRGVGLFLLVLAHEFLHLVPRFGRGHRGMSRWVTRHHVIFSSRVDQQTFSAQ